VHRALHLPRVTRPNRLDNRTFFDKIRWRWQSEFELNQNIRQDPLMVKIIIGVVFIIGGLTGKLVLIGTHSGVALAVVGVGMVIWGIARIAASRKA
jgi:hypothetical protein